MNSEEEMAQLSRDDVRLLRIVMQGAWQPIFESMASNEKKNLIFLFSRSRAQRASEAVQRLLHREPKVARTGDCDCACALMTPHRADRCALRQHHANIGAIMEATQFFASALHNKLGVPEFALKLRQDAALLGGKENLLANARGAPAALAAPGAGAGGAHERVMKARFDDDALAGVMHSLDEKQFAALRPDSAEVLLAHVGKFLRAASDEDFLLGALTLQELARTFADIFAHTRNQAHCQLALRVLQASTDRVHAINTPLFGVADAKELVVFLRDSIH
jgi:hypothetical protein